MLAQPKLTVCVPSRNRQVYFQETIRALLMNMRLDVEFVFADNSDDASIMNGFMQDAVRDPRVTYLPSTGATLSMVDNWDRCMEAVTGEFVCFIGDDDYVDIDLVDLIVKTQAAYGVVDAFSWNRLTYNWPGYRPYSCAVWIPLGTQVHRVMPEFARQEFFSWRGAKGLPQLSLGFYHGAVSKRLMDKIKARFGGRYCEYPTVDYENICKVLYTGERFVISERSFSVMGVCPESNSAKVRLTETLEEAHTRFMAEAGRNIDEDPHMKDFPFPCSLGVSACVAQTQNWFLTTYGLDRITGWEANFAEACSFTDASTEDSFNAIIKAYRDVFSQWHGGRYLKFFSPSAWKAKDSSNLYGVTGNCLWVSEEIGGVQTPAELYHLVEQMVTHRQDLHINARESRSAA